MATGSCICGKIAYSYEGEPALKALCHCIQCQKVTGTGFTYNFLVPREKFQITAGTPKKASFIQEIGVEVGYSFCPDCATILYKEAEADMFKPFYLVQAGTIEGSPLVREKPDVELWVSRKATWMTEVADTAQKTQF